MEELQPEELQPEELRPEEHSSEECQQGELQLEELQPKELQLEGQLKAVVGSTEPCMAQSDQKGTISADKCGFQECVNPSGI